MLRLMPNGLKTYMRDMNRGYKHQSDQDQRVNYSAFELDKENLMIDTTLRIPITGYFAIGVTGDKGRPRIRDQNLRGPM